MKNVACDQFIISENTLTYLLWLHVFCQLFFLGSCCRDLTIKTDGVIVRLKVEKQELFPFSVFLEYFLWLVKTLVILLNQIILAIHSLLGHTRLVFPRFASVMWIFFTLLLVHRTVIFVVIGCCKCLSAVSLPYCTSFYRIGSLTFKQLTTFSRSLVLSQCFQRSFKTVKNS